LTVYAALEKHDALTVANGVR